MTINKVSITIGIPAYNEEQNIKNLLVTLINQQSSTYNLNRIIVVSDASSDKTVERAKEVNDHRIEVISGAKRRGQSFRQNQIIDLCQTDILVLLNADILIKQLDFIESLVKPICNKHADLTSSALTTTESNSFLGKVCGQSYAVRNRLFENYRSGNNIYTCHGAARAFSKSLYRNFHFKESIAEDAYSYLSCVTQGYRYTYVKEALAYIKWPDNLKDHLSQSRRFFSSQSVLQSSFAASLLAKEYYLPKSLIVKSAIKFLTESPIMSITYAIIYVYSFLSTRFTPNLSPNIWNIAQSSKNPL